MPDGFLPLEVVHRQLVTWYFHVGHPGHAEPAHLISKLSFFWTDEYNLGLSPLPWGL